MMLFGLPEMKVFAETSSDPRIKALWARLKEARKKNALWCEEVNTLREQLRWRKWPEEKPVTSGRYLVLTDGSTDIGNHLSYWSRTAESWSTKDAGIAYWRPIGPLPGEGEE
jgi:hypothetical protein